VVATRNHKDFGKSTGEDYEKKNKRNGDKNCLLNCNRSFMGNRRKTNLIEEKASRVQKHYPKEITRQKRYF